MSSELIEALKQLEREKNIETETILDALKDALEAGFNRGYEEEEHTQAAVSIDPETGEIRVWLKTVVDPEAEVKEYVEEEITPKDIGRIAAQTAKQVILQRIREAEREQMYDEYVDRVGDIVTGIVQQSDQRYTLVNLGRVEALLPQTEQVPSERYEHGMRIKAYIVEVRRTTKEPQIIVSRSHPGLLKRLFELEVPEIYDGLVEIKYVAREPGHRSKIAVASRDASLDPVGACVGPKGSRVRMVVGELRGEKIDVVPYSEDAAAFVANALSPAKVKGVSIDEGSHTANVTVPDHNLSLAIGKEGQNARLAAKLTGWRIDIKSESQAGTGKPESRGEAAGEAEPETDGQCEAILASGARCKNRARPGSRYCGVHQKQEASGDEAAEEASD